MKLCTDKELNSKIHAFLDRKMAQYPELTRPYADNIKTRLSPKLEQSTVKVKALFV